MAVEKIVKNIKDNKKKIVKNVLIALGAVTGVAVVTGLIVTAINKFNGGPGIESGDIEHIADTVSDIIPNQEEM